MITNIDENMGKLMAKLKELGLEDDTILIFITDNGTSAGTWGGERL
jgi:arylsulfatase A-like enzyme